MGTYPRDYDKESFIKFLNENNVSLETIDKFKTMPEMVIHNGIEYKLNLVATLFTEGETFYNFEINYYSKKEIEFLFGYKIFHNVDLSITYATNELKKLQLM